MTTTTPDNPPLDRGREWDQTDVARRVTRRAQWESWARKQERSGTRAPIQLPKPGG